MIFDPHPGKHNILFNKLINKELICEPRLAHRLCFKFWPCMIEFDIHETEQECKKQPDMTTEKQTTKKLNIKVKRKVE